jgi:hypothetical protein
MPTEFLIIASFAFGCIVTWLWMTAHSRWQRGRGLIGRPGVVLAENEKRLREATQNRAQGCREMLRALVEVGVLLILTFLTSMFLGGVFS